MIQYAYCSHISFFKDKPNAKHTQTILSVIIDVIQYAYCSYISFFKDKPHAKHTQTIISVIQYGYYFYFCHSRIKFTMFTQQNYEFLNRKKFLLFLVLRNFFLRTRNKILRKSLSFLKLVTITLLRINVLKLRHKIPTKNCIFLNQAKKF